MAREYWVGTITSPEEYGPYSPESAAKESKRLNQKNYDEPLFISNSDDAY